MASTVLHVKPVKKHEKKPEIKENTDKQNERLAGKSTRENDQVPNIPGTCIGPDGLPEGSVETSLSTRMFPRSLHLKSTQSTPVNVGVGATGSARTVDAIDTMGAFIAKSNDSIEEKNRLKKIEPKEVTWNKPSKLWSCQSDSSIEEILWIPDTPAPDKDYMKLQVREFCVSETDSEHSDEDVYRPQTRIKKLGGDITSTSDEEEEETREEEEEEEEEEGEIALSDQPEVSESEESEREIDKEQENSKHKKKGERTVLKHDVTHRRETRVIARYDYTARSKGEISFKRGQIIKQKLGEDEYGFSYGWVRSNKFSQKHYGYYPAKMVTALSDEDMREP